MKRSQPRFEGSLRQRRGRLLRQVVAQGTVQIAAEDRVVATGLAADGLAILEDGMLLAPL